MEEPEIPDYYESLGVEPQSTVREIKVAFRRLAMLHHPDKQAMGTCVDAGEFCKIREAQEVLCDEIRRREYDRTYAAIHFEWIRYRREKHVQEVKEERRKAAAERIQRMEDAVKRKEGFERMRQRKEEERLAAQRAEGEKLRAQREREAEERSREAGRRLRERQEQEARDRLQKEQERRAEEEKKVEQERKAEVERRAEEEKKAEEEREARECQRRERESRAEERSKEAAEKRNIQQHSEAKERLTQLLNQERHDRVRREWARMRTQADSRSQRPSMPVPAPAPAPAVPVPVSNQAEIKPSVKCKHQEAWWLNEGPSRCQLCQRFCAKFSLRCSSCQVAACVACKTKHRRS